MRLQGKSILVLPDETPEVTEGGIINPLEKKKPDSGVVIGCGPGCEIVVPGDRIQYGRAKASIIEIEGKEHHFIIEEQIYFNHGQ